MPQASLIQDVEQLGERGEVVDVSKGYLRNFLIPRKLAEPATKGSIAAAERRREAANRAVADAESIECTDDDLQADLDGVAGRVGEEVEEVRERLERGGQMSAVRSDIRKRKALEWLLERAEVLDHEGATIDRSELELPSDEDDDEQDETEAEEAQA